MKRAAKTGRETRAFYAGLALVLVLMAALFWNGFAMTANAESKGTVTASSARIRQAAGTNSDAVGSVTNGTTVTILSEVQGADGHTWYQIQTAGGVKGYIRSDLMTKSAGSSTGTESSAVVVNPSVAVEEVQPVGGTITGGSPVRVRVDASTDASSKIITTLSNGTGITVNGCADGKDGKIWYLITFRNGSEEKQGFVRSDYVNLSGELLPVVEEAPVEEQPAPQDPVVQEPVVEKKPYDTEKDAEGNWCLIDSENEAHYSIDELLKAYTEIANDRETFTQKIRAQKIAITLLSVFLVLGVLAVVMFFYRMRDMREDAYISSVEKQTMRDREAAKRQGGSRTSGGTMTTVGTGSRPTGQKNAVQKSGAPVSGTGKATQAPNQQNRQAGARPTVNGRPANGTERPAGKASVQQNGQEASQQRATAPQQRATAPQQRATAPQQRATAPQQRAIAPQQRTVGQASAPNGAERTAPAAQNPSAAPRQAQPAAQDRQPQARTAPVEKSINPPSGQMNVKANTKPEWKTKNFMDEEEDEFEFEFLNWDGEEKE